MLSETGQDKVKKICEVLHKETLEPAKKEASEIIESAHEEKHRILETAKQEAEKMRREAKKKIEEERNVFQASLNLASKQALLLLKQEIEKEVFHKGLETLIGHETKKASVVAELISALIKAVEKEGIEGDLIAMISKTMPAHEVNRALTEELLSQLKGKSVVLSQISGGAQLKIVNKQMILDLSDEALKTMLVNYLREDFRSIFFKVPS